MTTGRVGRVSISGDLSLHQLPQRLANLLAAFDAELRPSDEMAVDLSGLEQVDTSCLAFLLELSRRAKKVGKPLRFEGAPETLQSLARLSSVDELLSL